MEKNRSPNSHEHLRQDTLPKSWSELPFDLLSLVFERLGFADFQRGKSICSSWYSASKQSVRKNQNPWLILFPDQNNNNNNCCTLFNPEEKDKLYKTQDLGIEFTKSVCVATYESWLLMRDPQYHLYIVNLFSHERIDLPSMEPYIGMTEFKRQQELLYYTSIRQSRGITIQSPVLWIHEKTKDYVVVWGLGEWCVFYAKKGDTLWNQIPKISCCLHMVYKDHKLYFFSFFGGFHIFDFSREIPRQTFECGLMLYSSELLPRRYYDDSWIANATKLVVTVTGDILRVERMVRPFSKIWSFRIYKFFSSGFWNKPEQVDSLGDEAMLLDLGITVLAKDMEGFNRNSIYFSHRHAKSTTDIFFFNLETQKMELVHKFECSCTQLSRARWFSKFHAEMSELNNVSFLVFGFWF